MTILEVDRSFPKGAMRLQAGMRPGAKIVGVGRMSGELADRIWAVLRHTTLSAVFPLCHPVAGRTGPVLLAIGSKAPDPRPG